MQGVQVLSPTGELRSHMPHGVVKKKGGGRKDVSLLCFLSSFQDLSKSSLTYYKNILFFFLLYFLETFKLLWYHSLAWADFFFFFEVFL